LAMKTAIGCRSVAVERYQNIWLDSGALASEVWSGVLQ
jgi:hypothetical protein